MASQGPLSAGTVTNDATFGTLAWSNLGNAAASDDTYATASYSGGSSTTTQFLCGANFGSTVPAGSTIDGIAVEWEKKSSHKSGGFNVSDTSVYAFKAAATPNPGNNNQIFANWELTDTYATYGGAADLWGQTWTVAEINGSASGTSLRASIISIAGAVTGSVDHVRRTVYYTPASSLPGSVFMPRQAVRRAASF